MTTNIKLLTDIRDKVIRIETHLKDMNGKVIRNEDFLRNICPATHNELTEAMSKLKTQMNGVIFVSSALTIAIITYIITLLKY